MLQPPFDFRPMEVLIGPSERGVFRLLQPADSRALLEFFERIPAGDRFYLKDAVTSKELIDGWCANIDVHRVLPIVVEVKGEIIAEGTLHRRRHPARRHIGEIRIVVDPRFREKGIGTRLMYRLIERAYAQQMDRVLFELVETQEEPAIRVAKELGFRNVAQYRNHVRDLDGKYHDLIVLEFDLKDWYRTDEVSNYGRMASY